MNYSLDASSIWSEAFSTSISSHRLSIQQYNISAPDVILPQYKIEMHSNSMHTRCHPSPAGEHFWQAKLLQVKTTQEQMSGQQHKERAKAGRLFVYMAWHAHLGFQESACTAARSAAQ